MSYKSAIEYLYGLQKFGMKFGLDNIRRLAAALGEPQRAFLTVHVAGTNGKGSTSAIIESILRTSGATTGLFTSPHLVNFTERIRINGEEISEGEVISLAEEVREAAEEIEDFSPTFFEVVAAMAFIHFRRRKVEWAVIETGLGGRLDATNIIAPEVSVITRIGLDHREFLGRTLKEIAAEKAGIIKERVPVVTAAQEAEAMEVIEERAAGKNSPLFRYGSGFSSVTVFESPEGIRFDYRGTGTFADLTLPLAGAHQAVNASMAVKTIEIISEAHPQMSCDVRKGIEDVRWPGRLEMIGEAPPILIDGAHNPQAAEALSLYLKTLLPSNYRRIILVAGIMGDKDIDGILRPLLPLAAEVIFTAPAYGRAASPELLSSRALAQGYASRSVPRLADAVNRARDLSAPGDLIVVTGSFYTIGEVKEYLGKQGVLTRLRE